MRERGKDVAIGRRTKVQASCQVGTGLLPVGQQGIGLGVGLANLGLDVVHSHALEVQVGGAVRLQAGLELVEDRVNESVPPVEDGIPHGRGHIAHHAELLQVPGIGIVGIGDDIMTLVVQVAIEVAVDGEHRRGLNHVAQDVNATNFVQLSAVARGLRKKKKYYKKY